VRQNILEAHPKAKLAVIAIWEPMLYGDSRNAIDRRMFDDPRAVNFWDPKRISGTWLAAHSIAGLGGGGGYVVWDAYYAFKPSATWLSTPTGAVAAGSDIIGSTGGLSGEFVPLLGRS
jgi:hypothetical protein